MMEGGGCQKKGEEKDKSLGGRIEEMDKNKEKHVYKIADFFS